MAEVLTDIADGVAVVTLDAPARRNALTLAMVDEITAALDTIEADPTVGAIVVTGAAPAFCAGADLSHLRGPADRRDRGPSGPTPQAPRSGSTANARRTTRDPSADALDESQREGLLRIYEGFLRIGRSPLPSVAAVNGAAVGAGVNLALVCDVIVAGGSSRFDTRFLQLGIHPGGGHTWMLQRRVGPQVAAAMVLFGRILDGRQAADVGLAWSCVADDELLAAAREMAGVAAAAPRDLVGRVKQTMIDVRSLDDHAEAVERELDPQVWSINQPAFQEKLADLQRRISSGS
jgi:enoyl-CoA hydratase